MQSSVIGPIFLKFFQDQGFSVLPRASLLDPSIPMSFVMSAGLVQVESALGDKSRPRGQKYILIQKCFRHFDIETVGNDDMHLSFFEMPGAFVFGPIDKFRVIQSMWYLLTESLHLDPQRLWVSFFAGGMKAGHDLEADTTAFEGWLRLGLPRERIIGLGAEHNFWMQGDGIDGVSEYHKCGPNTEVFWDRGAEHSCGRNCQPGCRCGRYLELANSLFIGLQIDSRRDLIVPLSEPFAETVIGTERLAMILQGKNSVFEIDALEPLIAIIESFCDFEDPRRLLYRKQVFVIADHIRALVSLVADGAPAPWGQDGEKGGRHRLIRMLIRRILAAQIVLGIHQTGFIPAIVDAVIEANEERRELGVARDRVLSYFEGEAKRFNFTLNRGRRELSRLLEKYPTRSFSGSHVVYLEKSYGIPKIILERELADQGISFNQADYNHAWQDWKNQISNEVSSLEAR